MSTKLIPILMISAVLIAACSPVPATGGESVLSDEALEIEEDLADDAMAMNLGSAGDKSLSDEGLELDERGLIEIAIDSSLGVLRYIPSVSASDQLVSAGSVVIAQVVSDGPGWIVIHTDDGGAPGAVVGFTALANGLNTNVEVMIDEALPADMLFAMLHIDAGELSVYEFPGADLPATRDGSVVMEAFSIN